jgi:Ino eighty subunit 1
VKPVFPEMRAQLRTYHAIPSLQAYQDPNSYKQLQDAPRLKSILKGASEDRKEPGTIEAICAAPIPRTNPVNLIFTLSQFAPRISDTHFPPARDFNDLIMKHSLSSKSRAKAFLWLMAFYLESDFTKEGADENPFGPGVDYGGGYGNQGVPELKHLSEEEQKHENVDKPREIEYGEEKMKERKRIIEADQADIQAIFPPKRGPKPKLNLPAEEGASPSLLSRIRPSKYDSDMDSTRSTPPPRSVGNSRLSGVMGASGSRRRGPLQHQLGEYGSSPVASGLHEAVTRRSRPLTAHQIAVEQNRNQRVDYILSRGLRKKYHQARKLRKQEGALLRAEARLAQVTNPFEDSEGEESLSQPAGLFREKGLAGLVQLESETDDFGEECAAFAAAIRRTGRRLDRWDSHKGVALGVIGTNRVAQPSQVSTNGHSQPHVNDDTEDEPMSQEPPRDIARAQTQDEDEDLDEMEKEILGLGSDNDNDVEEDLDDVDKALLGLRGDETEEDGSEGGMDLD